ncbi:hypothetical protein POSPLADRAFT_1041542 [Postia placenta MAD-698-R-SB12]|uniref:Uncharacterized protein n=1 Tax=Postia placenta MAD-698-R-SB12 TaxID=670580 RepID=A0A1X6MMQ2_9APHY|nr:hypothetical protein POSPLADRAFT_1041542 [Postia placenta MAD-698-R-SB12]OSX57549.1 hypothetical protein POSPLADRAFT_1041542 [Postia placenta MAD-698-R-SB12]
MIVLFDKLVLCHSAIAPHPLTRSDMFVGCSALRPVPVRINNTLVIELAVHGLCNIGR